MAEAKETIDLMPVFMLILGAGIVAFFGVFKTKSETLWKERYELLKALLEHVTIIASVYEKEALMQVGVYSSLANEHEQWLTERMAAGISLRKLMPRLDLLFAQSALKAIKSDYASLDESLKALFDLCPDAEKTEALALVSEQARELQIAINKLAWRKLVTFW